MPRRQYCADNLFLLGEMLAAAAQYISRWDDALDQEEVPMIELAYQQISPLKNRTVRLGKKIGTVREACGEQVNSTDSFKDAAEAGDRARLIR
jgi:hypothetical protein